jgi:hypothetical protein
MTHKIEIKPDRRKSEYSTGLLYNGAREIFVDGELWGRVYPSYHGCHGQTHVLHQLDPIEDNIDRCYRIGIGPKGRTEIKEWSDKHYLQNLERDVLPESLPCRIEKMVRKAIKDGHLRSPTVIAQERKEANARLHAAEAHEAEVKQCKLDKRANEALDAIYLAAGGITMTTKKYIAARSELLAAMKWAVDNA